MGFYVERTDAPNKSALAGEDIKAGTLVAIRSTGAFKAEAQTDENMDGVADTPRSGDYIADELDDASSFVYKAVDSEALSGAHRVPIGGYDDGAYIRVRTIESTSTNTVAPSIDHDSVVGFIATDETNGNDVEAAGRLVEEGYTNDEDAGGAGAAVTYNRTNNNFVAVGKAYMPGLEGDSVTSFDEDVRVIVDKGL